MFKRRSVVSGSFDRISYYISPVNSSRKAVHINRYSDLVYSAIEGSRKLPRTCSKRHSVNRCTVTSNEEITSLSWIQLAVAPITIVACVAFAHKTIASLQTRCVGVTHIRICSAIHFWSARVTVTGITISANALIRVFLGRAYSVGTTVICHITCMPLGHTLKYSIAFVVGVTLAIIHLFYSVIQTRCMLSTKCTVAKLTI